MKGAKIRHNTLYSRNYNEYTLIDAITETDDYKLLKDYERRNKKVRLSEMYNFRKSSKISSWKYWYKNIMTLRKNLTQRCITI